MRRRIRLTGRKQLARSCVSVKVFELDQKKVIGLSIADPGAFKGIPRDARVRLRLTENKVSETLEFGSLGEPKPSATLKNTGFVAPSCTLRIVSSEEAKSGLLLGSTDSFTVKTDEAAGQGGAQDGILLFLAQDIAPRAWCLDIRDNEYPIVYVDKKIPDGRTWARNDPVFVSCVLPAIISDVFREILDMPSPENIDWMKDWLRWADALMPGSKPPGSGDSRQEKADWMKSLLNTFSQHHNLLDRLVGHLATEGKPA